MTNINARDAFNSETKYLDYTADIPIDVQHVLTALRDLNLR
jgi:hypothetical protein